MTFLGWNYWPTLLRNMQLTENPVLFGRRYEEITDNLYGYKVQRHIIFYRIVIDDEIEIIRILHERMDIKNKFGI